MNLLKSIKTWSENKLPVWQQDAIRRLFQREDGLSEDDYHDLYILLKASHGLPNPKDLQPEPLKTEHLPGSLPSGETVVLEKMRGLTNVNLINPSETLCFAPEGMTVIYGGNGSGKSGYSRVMKRACRARDESVNLSV